MSIRNNNSSIIYADNNSNRIKTVGTPRDEYLSIQQEWLRNRAIIQGQQYAKDYDQRPDINTNLLLPFNSSMTQSQYDHYKAEAELPGVSSQYARMLTGGLLRKVPTLEINDNRINVEETIDWIMNRFGQGNESLISFLDGALWEEMQTSRAWIQVDYPVVDLETLTPEERRQITPFPRLWNAESIINWSVDTNPISGYQRLTSVIIRSYSPRQGASNFHPELVDTVWVHRLDDEGLYAIDTYINPNQNTLDAKYVDGQLQQDYPEFDRDTWTLVSTNSNIMINGERLGAIPFFPLNGSVEIQDPAFSPIVDREIALYNKISRRNHLLYLSATYTPIVQSDSLSDQEKDQLANQGLGTWMFIGQQDSITTLSTPTQSLTDMEAAIRNGYDEIIRIGVKMLSLEPNNSDVSGVALQIRNAAQNAQISTLNAKVSEQIKTIIRFMIHWRTGIIVEESNIRFNLSSDFARASTPTEVVRLISEWYQGGLIPRSLFIEIMKANDIIPSDYRDEGAVNEIEQDDLVMSPREQQESETQSVEQDDRNNQMEQRLNALEQSNNESSNSEETPEEESDQ